MHEKYIKNSAKSDDVNKYRLAHMNVPVQVVMKHERWHQWRAIIRSIDNLFECESTASSEKWSAQSTPARLALIYYLPRRLEEPTALQ